MNVNQIKALNLLVKTRSVSATARLMNVSQPAISKMVRSLEIEMGLSLLDHARGKVQPRSELEALLPFVERINQELSDLRVMTEDLRTGSAGSLVVSCSTMVGMSLVLPACRNLLARRPSVRTTVLVRGGKFSVDDVALNRADLAVEQLIDKRPNVVSCFVAKSRMVCVIPKGHALRRKREIQAEDLHHRRVILYPINTVNGTRIHGLLRDRGIDYEPIAQTDSNVLACRMVHELSVLGIMDYCPEVSAQYPNLMIKPFTPAVTFELHAMWKARAMRPALKTLVDELIEVGRVPQ
jgi:DNA-binding transcriptional LysR family regulator